METSARPLMRLAQGSFPNRGPEESPLPTHATPLVRVALGLHPRIWCSRARTTWWAVRLEPPMEKPRIYGSEAAFRATVGRSIRSGEDLLAQTEGARNRMGIAGSRENALVIEEEWERDFRRWFNRTGKALAQYLQEQVVGVPRGLRAETDSEGEDLLPVLGAGLPPDDGKPRQAIGIENGEAWLSKTLDELRALESALGPPNRPATARARRSSATFFGKPIWLALGAVGAVASVVGLVLVIIWH
jgi:hypothetical protein